MIFVCGCKSFYFVFDYQLYNFLTTFCYLLLKIYVGMANFNCCFSFFYLFFFYYKKSFHFKTISIKRGCYSFDFRVIDFYTFLVILFFSNFRNVFSFYDILQQEIEHFKKCCWFEVQPQLLIF
jgi:hypothetical protein